MPTPPRETIGGKLLPNQEMSFNHMNQIYRIVTELENFLYSEEYKDLDKVEQDFYHKQFSELNNSYENLLLEVNKY